MAELADALDSGSSEHNAHAGSSPVIRIKPERRKALETFVFRAFLFCQKRKKISNIIKLTRI